MGYIIRRQERSVEVSNTRKLFILSLVGLLLSVLAVVIALIDPVAVLARYNTRLKQNSPVHKLLQKKIEGVHVQAYLFNITNEERFLKQLDSKLKVEEVGPFTYLETRSNEDLELDEDAGILRYTPKTTVTFLPKLSIGDPKKINVTMPNIALLAMTSMLSSYSSWTKIPFNLLVKRLRVKPVVTIDAHNYLWGYDEPLITFGNTVLPGWINFDRMGIMDRLYDQKSTYRLEVGATNADKFLIHTLNGIKGIKALNYEDANKRTKCNTFVDTYEGIAYPPNMTPASNVRIWRNVLCRIFELDFAEELVTDYGARALVYKISNRTYNYNPDKLCTCGKGACYNGVSDLAPCFFGLPLAISNAHFLDAEPKLFRRIEGLNPNEEEHGSKFMIEPTVGMALGTSFTVQVNVVVDDVKFNSEAEAFSDMVVPIGYFRIVQPELHEQQLHDLRMMWIYGPRIFLAGEMAMFLVGIALLGYAMRQILWDAAFCGETRTIDFKVEAAEKSSQEKATHIPLTLAVESQS